MTFICLIPQALMDCVLIFVKEGQHSQNKISLGNRRDMCV